MTIEAERQSCRERAELMLAWANGEAIQRSPRVIQDDGLTWSGYADRGWKRIWTLVDRPEWDWDTYWYQVTFPPTTIIDRIQSFKQQMESTTVDIKKLPPFAVSLGELAFAGLENLEAEVGERIKILDIPCIVVERRLVDLPVAVSKESIKASINENESVKLSAYERSRNSSGENSQ